jgi:hypothetical protein
MSPPPDKPAALGRVKQSRVGTLLLATAVITAAVVLFVFNPATAGFYPFCPLHRLTGLLCPGCGALRAIHELLHGNVVAAFHLNALLVLSLPVLAAVAARLFYLRIRGQPVSFGISGGVFWTGFVIAVLFGIFRNF